MANKKTHFFWLMCYKEMTKYCHFNFWLGHYCSLYQDLYLLCICGQMLYICPQSRKSILLISKKKNYSCFFFFLLGRVDAVFNQLNVLMTASFPRDYYCQNTSIKSKIDIQVSLIDYWDLQEGMFVINPNYKPSANKYKYFSNIFLVFVGNTATKSLVFTY